MASVFVLRGVLRIGGDFVSKQGNEYKNDNFQIKLVKCGSVHEILLTTSMLKLELCVTEDEFEKIQQHLDLCAGVIATKPSSFRSLDDRE